MTIEDIQENALVDCGKTLTVTILYAFLTGESF